MSFYFYRLSPEIPAGDITKSSMLCKCLSDNLIYWFNIPPRQFIANTLAVSVSLGTLRASSNIIKGASEISVITSEIMWAQAVTKEGNVNKKNIIKIKVKAHTMHALKTFEHGIKVMCL